MTVQENKQGMEKEHLYMCLSRPRPQIMCSGHTEGKALSAFSQSWRKRGINRQCNRHTHTHKHLHVQRVRRVNSVCKSGSWCWSNEGRGDCERSSTFPSSPACFNLVLLPCPRPVCLCHSSLQSLLDMCCSELQWTPAPAWGWHQKMITESYSKCTKNCVMWK